MQRPLVSVLMPVRNGQPHLGAAVDSILKQDFDDFEFIIVDDGSTDGSWDLIRHLADARVVALKNRSSGLVSALNYGISKVRGSFIARMDADDISRPDRLRIQLERFKTDERLGLVCSNARVIDEMGRLRDPQRESWPDPPETFLRDGLLYRLRMKPIIHPSVMVRTELLRNLGYREFPHAEDRDLWLRAIKQWKFDRIQADLLDYRVHARGVSRASEWEQAASSAMAALNALVCDNTGTDMYETDKALFNATRDALSAEIMTRVVPAASDFRSARASIRAREWPTAMRGVVTGVGRHGINFRPDAARRTTRAVIEELAMDAIRALEARR